MKFISLKGHVLMMMVFKWISVVFSSQKESITSRNNLKCGQQHRLLAIHVIACVNNCVSSSCCHFGVET